MTISFGGLASGLPVNDIIDKLIAVERQPIDKLESRKSKVSLQNTTYSSISSRFTALRDSILKLTDAHLSSSSDLFATKAATTSNSSNVTATATNDAAATSFSLDILNLATSTKAKSTTGIGSTTTTGSNVDEVNNASITSGNFTVFVDGVANTISVDKDVDTVQNVLDRITTAVGGGATATVNGDGEIEISNLGAKVIRFGATGDTSNFATQTYLSTGSLASSTFTAAYGTSTLSTSASLTDNTAARLATAVTAGTFTIGTETFTVSGSSTLAGIIGQINASSKAGVTAVFNTNTQTIELTAKTTGAQAITLGGASDTSNFLSAIKLVTGGNSLASQTLGENAQFKINNGNTIESTSNTADSTVHGLNGVTLNLLAETTSAASVSVSPNTDKLTTAIKDVIDKLNAAFSAIRGNTSSTGVLKGDTSLKRLLNELKSEVFGQANTGLSLSTYKTLTSIGITTGTVTASSSITTVDPTLQFDSSKFLTALTANPSEVKKLLIGDGSTNGVFSTLNDTVKAALDGETGVFASHSASASNQITTINNAITRAEAKVAAKEKSLKAQYAEMERLISKYKEQGNSISGLTRINK